MKQLVSVLICLILTSCSSTGRKGAKSFEAFLKKGDYQKAITLAKSKDFYPEQKDQLIKLIELATAHFLQKNYYQSLKTFDEAKDVSDKLFTVSIKKKISAAMSNNNSDNYYGEKYERSLIRFYQALNHALLYQTGKYETYTVEEVVKDKKISKVIPEKILNQKEKRQHLFSARAVILEWDSLLKNYRSQLAGETAYKEDMLAKTFGAYVHNLVGTRSDKQIAKNLLKDANRLLFQNYNSYPTFNGKFQKFRDDFEKLPKMKKSIVEKEYVDETVVQKQLKDYLNANNKGNVTIVLNDGLVAAKTARVIDFPIDLGAVGTGAAIAGKSGLSLYAFTLQALRLGKAGKPSISFELPEVKRKPVKAQYELSFTQNGKEVSKIELAIINPLSDLANEALDEKIVSTYASIGARLALKHAAAIGTAYVAYKAAVRNGTPEFLAQIMGAGLYTASNKAISASEKADLRYWSSLPHTVRMANANLSEGNYQVTLLSNGQKIKDLGTATIGKSQQLLVFNNL